MADPKKALQTQLKNIEAKTGKSLAQLLDFIKGSSLIKHGELRSLVQETFELGYGDANTLVAVSKQTDEVSSEADALDTIYSAKKADLKPLHNHTMAWLGKLGEFEVAPKKTYLSLRKKKQFMTVGPGSKGRLELGINAKGLISGERLEASPAGKMCQYRVYLTAESELDDDLREWVTAAFKAAE